MLDSGRVVSVRQSTMGGGFAIALAGAISVVACLSVLAPGRMGLLALFGVWAGVSAIAAGYRRGSRGPRQFAFTVRVFLFVSLPLVVAAIVAVTTSYEMLGWAAWVVLIGAVGAEVFAVVVSLPRRVGRV